MRIVIATGIFPPDIGGPATYCVEVTKEFQAADHTVDICTFGEEKNTKGVFRVSRKNGIILRYWKFTQCLWRVSKGSDIIYAHDLFSVGISAAIVRVFRRNIRLVFRLGGDFLWEKSYNSGITTASLDTYYAQPKCIKEKMLKWIAGQVLDQADHIIFSTEWQRDIYVQAYQVSMKKCSVIENAFPGKKNIVSVENGPIVFAGRLIPLKRVDVLLRAVAKVPELQVEIAGSGPEEGTLQLLAHELGITNRVCFRGNLGRADLDALLQKARAVIIPSASDISPQLAYEALIRNIPLILTKYTGLDLVLSQVAWCVDPNDIDSIRSACEKAMDSNERAKAIQNIAAFNMQRGWKDVAQEHVQLFEKQFETRTIRILSLGTDTSVQDEHSETRNRLSTYAAAVERYIVLVPTSVSSSFSEGALTIYGVAGKNKCLQFLALFKEAWILTKTEHCTVISAQDIYYIGFLAFILGKIRGIGVELQVHGWEKYSGFRKRIATYILPRVQAVRTVGISSKNILVKEIGVTPECITVVPVHLPVTSSLQVLKEKKTPAKPFVFLSVSRLVPIKRIDVQIKAMQVLAEKGYDVCLRIAGDGSERVKIEKNVPENVTLLGWLSQDELAKEYHCADAFIQTSESEGWGRTVLEAARAQLPVISTDVGVVSELFSEKDALKIPDGNVDALVQKMIVLMMDESLRDNLALRAKAIVESLPSYDETIELYRLSWQKSVAYTACKKRV